MKKVISLFSFVALSMLASVTPTVSYADLPVIIPGPPTTPFPPGDNKSPSTHEPDARSHTALQEGVHGQLQVNDDSKFKIKDVNGNVLYEEGDGGPVTLQIVKPLLGGDHLMIKVDADGTEINLPVPRVLEDCDQTTFDIPDVLMNQTWGFKGFETSSSTTSVTQQEEICATGAYSIGPDPFGIGASATPIIGHRAATAVYDVTSTVRHIQFLNGTEVVAEFLSDPSINSSLASLTPTGGCNR